MNKAVLMSIVLVSLGGFAAAQEGAGGPPVLAKEIAKAKGGGKLMVTSPVFSSGEQLDNKYTQNGENVSPPIAWSKGPTGTRSYVILTEDSGVNRHDPVFHWVVYNVPSTVTSLPEHMSAEAKLDDGGMQGLNVRKTAGFLGPKPPAGQTHPYHFEVFALNTRLDLDPSKADRNAVVDAMKGHVLAEGDIVAEYTGR